MLTNLDGPQVPSPRREEEPYILCEDLFKIYKQEDLEVVALRGLDLKVKRGELMAIVGGRNLLNMTPGDLVDYRRQEVGFVWQQTSRNVLPYLTAVQNVELPMILEGAEPGPARSRARELLEMVGLGHRLEIRPDRLSGGEQQRVAIAIALANDPPLLLADEPTGELDSQTAAEVFAVMRGLNQELNVTIVVVTHDPAIANQIDRIVAIRDGRISTESFRRIAFEGREAYVYHDEYAVVDRTGRLQIPKEFLERIEVKERARLRLGTGQVEVLPEDASLEEND
jgi:putative ABC transport system ATP-binding protein